MAEYDQVYRVVLVGDTNVGKTCVVKQFCNSSFEPEHSATIGIDFMTRTIELSGEPLIMQVWDTAGQDRYQSITRQYFRRAQGVLLLFDISKRKTFDSLLSWLDQVKQFAPNNVIIFAVGNKADLDDTLKQISSTEAQTFCQNHKIQYFEASAKTSQNIDMIFQEMASILRKEFANECLFNQRNKIRDSKSTAIQLTSSSSSCPRDQRGADNNGAKKNEECCSC